MDDNTRIKAKAWRNRKKNSYEFFRHYMGDLLDDDWQDKLKKNDQERVSRIHVFRKNTQTS